jgi:hypothetical protein
MSVSKTTGLGLALAMLVGASTMGTSVAAQAPGPKERREDRKEAREERREDRKEAREEGKDAREERREDRKEAREEGKDAREERRDDRKEWREHRRTARRAFLDKWGPIHKQPAVRTQLELHARRLARLTRMRALASEASKAELVKKLDALLAKENALHDKRMEQLKGGAK